MKEQFLVLGAVIGTAGLIVGFFAINIAICGVALGLLAIGGLLLLIGIFTDDKNRTTNTTPTYIVPVKMSSEPSNFCAHCGAKMHQGVRLCINCGELNSGHPVSKKCPGCGQEMPYETKVCPGCTMQF